MQGRGVICVAVRLNDDLHILIERHEKTQKPLNGELPEVPAQHLGYIGLADAEQIRGLHLFRAKWDRRNYGLENASVPLLLNYPGAAFPARSLISSEKREGRKQWPRTERCTRRGMCRRDSR
jgi:hypothetical protein